MTVQDDDERLTLTGPNSGAILRVPEGGTNTYKVKLGAMPTDTVTVTPTALGSSVTVSEALTFTTENWNVNQTITVTASNDNVPGYRTALIAHSVIGGGYNLYWHQWISVEVDDDDAALTVTGTTHTVAEAGGMSNVRGQVGGCADGGRDAHAGELGHPGGDRCRRTTLTFTED